MFVDFFFPSVVLSMQGKHKLQLKTILQLSVTTLKEDGVARPLTYVASMAYAAVRPTYSELIN